MVAFQKQVAAISPPLHLVRSFIQNPYPVPLKQATPGNMALKNPAKASFSHLLIVTID